MGKSIEQKKSSRGQILQVVLLRHFPNSLPKWSFFSYSFFIQFEVRVSAWDETWHWLFKAMNSSCPYIYDLNQQFLVYPRGGHKSPSHVMQLLIFMHDVTVITQSCVWDIKKKIGSSSCVLDISKTNTVNILHLAVYSF